MVNGAMRWIHTPFILAALMIGHNFRASTLCNAPSTSGAAPQTVALSPNPVISCGGVVNFAGPLGGIASGTWMSIYGNNLSSTTRAWSPADFVGRNLPVSIDNVTVTVGGVPAYVYFVSPTQINALAPGDPHSGLAAAWYFASSRPPPEYQWHR